METLYLNDVSKANNVHSWNEPYPGKPQFFAIEKGSNRKSFQVFVCLKGYDGNIPNDEQVDK